MELDWAGAMAASPCAIARSYSSRYFCSGEGGAIVVGGGEIAMAAVRLW